MVKKLRTINIDEKLWKEVQKQTNNISKLVSELLETYLQTDSVDKINDKIKELETQISIMNVKKMQIIKKDHTPTQKIYNELKANFFMRKRNERNVGVYGEDKLWIKSKPIAKKIKALGIEPDLLLKQLLKDFDDLESKIDSERQKSQH